jgi:hypothetical protein
MARELHQKQCAPANKWLVFVTGDGGMATQMTRERLKWSQQSEGGFRSGGFRSTVFPHIGTAKVYSLIFRLSRVVNEV